MSAEEYRQRLEIIRRAADDAGRRLERFTATHTMAVALGNSREQVLERAMTSRICAAMALGAPAGVWRAHGRAHPLGDTHRGFLDLVPSRITAAQVDCAAATMTPQIVLTLLYAGNARQICEEAAPLADAGCGHFIVANAGASFTGEGAKGLWRLAELMRRLRRL